MASITNTPSINFTQIVHSHLAMHAQTDKIARKNEKMYQNVW